VLKRPDAATARQMLLDMVVPIGTERVFLGDCAGRVLAQDVFAQENIPPFDRSPYDGYAFRAEDAAEASQETPVVLRIVEEVPAGTVPAAAVTRGTAVKILTGAPIPEGADAVVPYEQTAFTKETVTLFSPAKAGQNVVRAGEDVKKGDLLARRGSVIDAGLAGVLASQGLVTPEIYRLPKIGILSTGRELVEAETVDLEHGMIRDSNRLVMMAALKELGCACVDLGIAQDSAEEISAALRGGIDVCDAIVSTGGVSVGDYDLMPDALELAGGSLLFRGVEMKPGMACAYGVCEGKLICGLSGNPASAFTNFHVIAVPVLRKLMGRREFLHQRIRLQLTETFAKKSPVPRFLRGKLELENGTARVSIGKEQGNAVLSSTIGCDVMAVIPAGSGSVPAGTELDGFRL